jgi:RecA-family ATPase
MPNSPQLHDNLMPPDNKKVVSLNPDTAVRAIDSVLSDCKQYLIGRSTNVDHAFATHSGDSLIIGIEKRRFMLHQLTNDGQIGTELPTGLYSLKDLLSAEIPKPNPVIEDFLCEGDVMLLGGRPKVGKSRIVHQMTLSLSNASPFLGMKVPRRRRVLLIDLENKPWSIRDRLERMAPQDSATIDTAFVWCSNSLAENTVTSKPQGIDLLQTLLDQTKRKTQ